MDEIRAIIKDILSQINKYELNRSPNTMGLIELGADRLVVEISRVNAEKNAEDKIKGLKGVYPKLTEDQVLAEVARRRCGR